MNAKHVATCLWALCLVVVTGDGAGGAEGIAAITHPSADVTLSFIQPGLIAEVRVKQGDTVEANQLLVRQNDAVERAQLAQIEAQCQNRSQIEAGEASLAQKQVDLKKLKKAALREAVTELEVEHAQLAVRMAELSLEIARLEQRQNELKEAAARGVVERMQLRSPIAGTIEALHVEPGESANALADVVRVVQTDPLWIDVPVPMARARALKTGQKALVSFPDGGGAGAEARVIFVAAVAEAASETLLVRVEVPNKTRRPAGEHVSVGFPDSP